MCNKGMTTITFNITKELSKRFKGICVENDTTMTNVLLDSIERYCNEKTNQDEE